VVHSNINVLFWNNDNNCHCCSDREIKIETPLIATIIGSFSSDVLGNLFFFIKKMRVKLLNFIIIHKDFLSEFRTHDLSQK
jgi:hypothetical protein